LQVNCFIFPFDLPLQDINAEVRIGELYRIGYITGPPDKGLDPGQKFGKGKGFCQVIIGAGLKSVYPVIHPVPCTQDNDGSIVFFHANIFDEGNAVHFRQHDIHDHGIIGSVKGHFKPCFPGHGLINGKPG